MNWKKLLAGLWIILLVFNIVFFVMGKITSLLFWFIIIISAIFAYKVIPWIGKK